MKFKDYYNIITEMRKSRPLIIVDVQPEYMFRGNISHNNMMNKIIQLVNNYSGPILMFVNAENTGVSNDTINSIKEFWEEHGFDRDWEDIEIIDKGYGYLRSWMDENVPESDIIKAIRIMFQKKIYDSRDIVESHDEVESYDKWRELLNNPDIPDDMISVNWISIKKLKDYSGGYLIGGGRNECLKEIEIIMNAFNLKYKKIDAMIY